MKPMKKRSQHSFMTVNSFFTPQRRLPLSAILALAVVIVAGFFYSAAPPTVKAASTTILISEVEQSGTAGGTAGEWFELVNVSNAAITLTNWTVTDSVGTLDIIPTITINPGDYVVIAAEVSQFNTNHPSFVGTVVELPSASIGSNGLTDTGERIELRDGSSNLIDAMSYGSDTTYFSLPENGTGNTRTYQRANTFDTDGSKDWTVSVETPGAPAPILPYLDSSSSAGDFDSILDTGFISGKTLTWSHTVGSGNNPALVVGISTEVDDVAGLPGDRVSGVTYGGVAMTRIAGTSSRDTANRVGVEMFILVNPPTGTANVEATILPSVNYVVGGSASFFNVNQTTPTRAVSIASSTTGSPTTTFTTVVGDIVIDTVATLPSGFLAPGAGQTQRWDGQSFFSESFDVGAGSTEPAGTTSTTMNWTSNSQNWAISAVSLQPAAVTLVKLADFTATQSDAGVALRWQTGDELNNLGFNVYREQRGKRTRINPEIIAGSALLATQGTRLTAGQSYAWQDRAGRGKDPVQYWLEDIDLDGTRTLHGPITASAADETARTSSAEQAMLLSQLNESPESAPLVRGYPAALKQSPAQSTKAQAQEEISPAPVLQRKPLVYKLLGLSDERLAALLAEDASSNEPLSVAQETPLARQRALASGAAIKIKVRQAGWYRVTQAELVAAGLSPNIDPTLLQLYADGVEQPILHNGNKKQFGSDASIEFYGTGMDTPTSDTRTYWLIVGSQPGRRINSPGTQSQDTTIWIDNATPAPSAKPQTTANPGAAAVDKPAGRTAPPATAKPGALIPQPWLILSNPQPSASADDAPKTKKKKKAARKKNSRKPAKERHHGFIRSHAQEIEELPSSQGFAYTWERKERINYFSGLLNGGTENFFGPLVLAAPVNQALSVGSIDRTSSAPATLEVALQGLTLQPHQVRVSFNGAEIGVISFEGHERGVISFSVPRSSLIEGNNTVTLASIGGESDISLIDYLRLTYRRAYRAENDSLVFTSQHTTSFKVDGFTTPQIRVFDITDATAVKQLPVKVSKQGAGYAVKIPGGSGSLRTLLAVTEGQVQRPASVTANEPSNWSHADNRADFVILTHRDFREAAKPLADLRSSQGLEVKIVDVADIYDEFSYGAHSRQAVRDFLAWTKSNWALAPRYALLMGDASIDPRNYLGFGQQDFVPTMLIDTAQLETASDDLLGDFNGDGLADVLIGRLPVRNLEQAQKVIGKITNYSPGQAAHAALLVSDRKDGYDFEAANNQVRSLLPESMNIAVVNRRDNSPEQVRGEVIGGINIGPLLVNYAGHGSSDVWTGAGILNAADASTLTNGNRLPLFVIMTCLNGRFQDPFRETLAEALMRAEGGGAAAVWASSGMTEPGAQAAIDQQLMRLLFGAGQSPTLGEAVRGAKEATTNVDVRRTWILFGDPTMRIR
jgi:hypothetical protein